MSLYNQLFGVNDEMPILLGMLGVNKEYFDRFRDIELIKQGTIIRVLTRTGGCNRKDYEDNWKTIRSHELFITDYDDKLDNTYAYIEFNIPNEYKHTASKMFKEEPMTFEDKFNKEMKEMNKEGTEASKRAEIIANKIMGAIENGDKNIEI